MISLPEKKLALALKAVLVLEAVAKVVFVVFVSYMQKSKLPRLPELNYNHVYLNSSASAAQMAKNYTLCSNSDAVPTSFFIADW